MHNTPTSSDKTARYLRRQGVRATTTPDRAAHHITHLRRAGMRDHQIATAARIGATTLYRIAQRHGPITRAVEQRILAVTAPVTGGTVTSLNLQPIHGTARRLQALVHRGYPPHWIARQLAWHRQKVDQLLHCTYQRVTLRTAAHVAALYLEHWDVDAEAAGLPTDQAARARQLAAHHSWHPAAVWDDIDHPDATPDYGQHVSRVRAVVDDAYELARQGYSREGVARRLGLGWDAVRQACRRDGTPLPTMLD